MGCFRRTDVVVIEFVVINGVRIIQAFRVIGSAFPCQFFLFVGALVSNAQNCLLANGFTLVSSRRNVLVFERP